MNQADAVTVIKIAQQAFAYAEGAAADTDLYTERKRNALRWINNHARSLSAPDLYLANGAFNQARDVLTQFLLLHDEGRLHFALQAVRQALQDLPPLPEEEPEPPTEP